MVRKKLDYNRISHCFLAVIFSLTIFLSVSCNKLPEAKAVGSNITKSGNPQEIGISQEEMKSIISNIEKEFPAIRSLLIMKDDALLYEWNKKGINAEDIVAVHSGVKIVTAILAGIAIDEGLFLNEYTTIEEICPNEYLEKENITESILNTDIHMLLTMKSGIRFEAMNSSLKVIIQRIKSNSNVLYNLIRLPIYDDKVGEFEYSTESYMAINAMISEVAGKTDYEYAKEKLFIPLGISPVAYTADFENMGNVSRDLYLRPIDFAKIGMLLLNNGVYEGKQIVSKEWIDKCMTKQIRGKGEEYPNQQEIDFAYGMWIDELNGEEIVYSYGKNGQYIILIPKKGIVLTILSDEKAPTVFYRDKVLNWLLVAME